MKNKENLLVEVNRIREMMGLNLIMEQGIGSLTKKVLGFFGYTDEAMEAVAKNIDVDVLVKNSIDALETKALQKGIDIANATEDQLLKLIDESPTIKNEIEVLYRKATKDAADKLIANLGILPSEITDLVTRATATKLHPSIAQRASDLYGNIWTRLDNLSNQLQAQGNPIPKELQELKDLITVKQIEADEMVNFKRPTSVDNTGTSNLEKEFESLMLKDVQLKQVIKETKASKYWGKLTQAQKNVITDSLKQALSSGKTVDEIGALGKKKAIEYAKENMILGDSTQTKKLKEFANWATTRSYTTYAFVIIGAGLLGGYSLMQMLGIGTGAIGDTDDFVKGKESSEDYRKEESGDSGEPTIEDATAWIGTLNGSGGDLEGLTVKGLTKDPSGVENMYIATLSDDRAQKLLWDPTTKKFTPQ